MTSDCANVNGQLLNVREIVSTTSCHKSYFTERLCQSTIVTLPVIESICSSNMLFDHGSLPIIVKPT